MCVQFFREIPKELIYIAGFVEWFCCCGCYLLVKLLCYLCFAVLLIRLVKLVQQFSAQNRYTIKIKQVCKKELNSKNLIKIGIFR